MKKERAAQPRQKGIYRVRNWSAYDRALMKRGSVTVWLTPEALAGWYAEGEGPKKHERGGQQVYSDVAIQTVLTFRELFGLPNRATEGFVASLFEQMKVELEIPDHTTLSRRGKTLRVNLTRRSRENLTLVIDSSGLKVYGEGEWKVRQHGYSKRRTWRKMHIGIDADTGEIVTGVLTEAGVDDAAMAEEILAQAGLQSQVDAVIGDGAYDKDKVYQALSEHTPQATVLIPPRTDAHIWQHGNSRLPPHPRDTNLRAIRKTGRRHWKAQSGYHQRSLIENTMYRYKTIFDDHLTARKIDTQATQFGVRCAVLNRMTALGRPDSYRIG